MYIVVKSVVNDLINATNSGQLITTRADAANADANDVNYADPDADDANAADTYDSDADYVGDTDAADFADADADAQRTLEEHMS